MLVILGPRRKLPTTRDFTQLQTTITRIELLCQRRDRFADHLFVFLEDISDRLHTQRLIRNKDQRLDHGRTLSTALRRRQRRIVVALFFGSARRLLHFGHHRRKLAARLFIQRHFVEWLLVYSFFVAHLLSRTRDDVAK